MECVSWSTGWKGLVFIQQSSASLWNGILTHTGGQDSFEQVLLMWGRSWQFISTCFIWVSEQALQFLPWAPVRGSTCYRAHSRVTLNGRWAARSFHRPRWKRGTVLVALLPRSAPAPRQEPGRAEPASRRQRRAPPAKRQQRPGLRAFGPRLASAGPGRARCPRWLPPHSPLLTGSVNVGGAGSRDASPPGSAPDGLWAPAGTAQFITRTGECAMGGLGHCQLLSRSLDPRSVSRVTRCELWLWTRGKPGSAPAQALPSPTGPAWEAGEQRGIWGTLWDLGSTLGFSEQRGIWGALWDLGSSVGSPGSCWAELTPWHSQACGWDVGHGEI